MTSSLDTLNSGKPGKSGDVEPNSLEDFRKGKNWFARQDDLHLAIGVAACLGICVLLGTNWIFQGTSFASQPETGKVEAILAWLTVIGGLILCCAFLFEWRKAHDST